MFFTGLLIFYYIFGILLYDCLPFIQWIDEVFPWILLLYALLLRNWRIPRSFVIFLGIAMLYLAYSFIIHSNVPKAILFDFVVQMKPFVTFFSVMMIAPQFGQREKKMLRYTLLAGIVLMFVIGLTRVGKEVANVQGEVLTGARLSFTALYSGIAYLMFSSADKKSLKLVAVICCIGFLAPTSKFLAGFALLAILFMFALPSLKKYRLLVVIAAVGVLALLIYLTAADFSLYLSSDETARAALYITSALILKDYFPFGSGLASFGTSASGNYYSSLYPKYGVDMIHGLSESDAASGDNYISDTGLVALAEFGIAGIFIFILFYIFILRSSYKRGSVYFNILIVFILLDIIIESISDSTLIGNRGVFMMILLAILVSNQKTASYECQQS